MDIFISNVNVLYRQIIKITNSSKHENKKKKNNLHAAMTMKYACFEDFRVILI